MMKSSVCAAILWLAVLSGAAAYAVSGGAVYLNDKEVFAVLGDVQTVEVTSPKDVLSFSVAIGGASRPHQLLLLVSNDQGLDFPVYGLYDDGTFVAKVPVHKLPNALKAQERLTVTLVAANDDADEPNVAVPVAAVALSDGFRETVEHKKPVRLGAAPEIHHIFREDPATVHAIVPLVFSAAAGVLLLGLFAGWTQVLNGAVFGSPQGSTWKAAFLATLAMFEVTFVRYYLGATIFTTIFHVFLLAGPYLFFGSRALSTLARVRATGKA